MPPDAPEETSTVFTFARARCGAPQRQHIKIFAVVGHPRKPRKFAPCESFLLYGMFILSLNVPVYTTYRSEGSSGKSERLQSPDERVPHPRAPCCQQPGGHQVSSAGHLCPLEESQDHQLPSTEIHLPSGGHLQGSEHTATQG